MAIVRVILKVGNEQDGMHWATSNIKRLILERKIGPPGESFVTHQ